jgi:hypothetical protein
MVAATMEVKPSDQVSSNIMKGTKRKLDWFTEQITVRKRSCLMDTDTPVEAQSSSLQTPDKITDNEQVPDIDLPPNLDDIASNDDYVWEHSNSEICKRNIALKAPKIAKSTWSSLNIGTLNIASRDIGTTMNQRKHKFKYVKHVVDQE